MTEQQFPKTANHRSFKVPVEQNSKYYWCSCGLSDLQPFCDGSHKGTEFLPMEYVAQESKVVSLCGCKKTKKPPFCDGSHNSAE